jgi:anti-sigma regulatory factor (Ser/Thr protein kinase)/serine/threonine protein phosphatase PrpC
MSRFDLGVRQRAHVVHARLLAARAGRAAGLSDAQVDRVALAATELATNLVAHAEDGVLFGDANGGCLDMVAVDRGPGIRHPEACLRDGFSTRGGLGAGLGAVRRAADEFDLYSRVGHGTAVLARWWPASATPFRLGDIGGLTAASPGERDSGDAWTVLRAAACTTLVVCDGLGHGRLAARASEAALEVARKRRDEPPAALLTAMHRALAGTRGAAVAIAQLRSEEGVLRFAGIGNVAARLVTEAGEERLVSRPGIVGGPAGSRIPTESVHPWRSGSLLALHTDGLTDRWSLRTWPELVGRHVGAVAGWLLWQAYRQRDDACVLVASTARSTGTW